MHPLINQLNKASQKIWGFLDKDLCVNCQNKPIHIGESCSDCWIVSKGFSKGGGDNEENHV
jgi:hypothetical protein